MSVTTATAGPTTPVAPADGPVDTPFRRSSPVDHPAQSADETTDPLVDLPVIELAHPMPGFPGRRRFALVRLDEDGPLCSLRSLEDAELRFLVLSPQGFFPGYEPVLDDATVSDLEINSPDDVLVLVVVNPSDSLAGATVNLLAPVVVNTANRRAAQVILDDVSLPVSAPLL